MAEDRYLREVSHHLPFDAAVTAEVIEELAGHLQDSTEAIIESGISPDEARRRAVRAMGHPEELAKDIARAHQTRQRLLAAAGAGAWTAMKSGIRGMIIGWVMTMLVVFAIGATIVLLRDRLLFDIGPGIDLPNRSDQTVVLALALGLGAYMAGRKVPPVVARVSRHDFRRARWATGLALAVLALFVGLFWLRSGQSPLSVLALGTLPLWALAGVRHADRPPSRLLSGRSVPIVALVAVLGILAFFLLATTTRVPTSESLLMGEAQEVRWSDPYEGFRRAGEADLMRAGGPLLVIESRHPEDDARSVTVTSERTLPALDELRIEVWPAADLSLPGPGGIDTSRVGPILAVPLVTDDMRETAHRLVDFSAVREVGDVYLIATGASDDGVRHILNQPEFEQIQVEHTVWEWLLAR